MTDIVKTFKSRSIVREIIIKKYENMGNPIPQIFLENAGRMAVLPAHIASASSIDFQFYGQAIKQGLVPVWDEYLSDKFTTANGRKVAYARPYDKYGKQIKICDLSIAEGKKLKDVLLLDGTNLVDYHHAKWDSKFTGTKALRTDTSEWLSFFGDASEYYYHVMILNTFFAAKFWPANIEALYRAGEKDELVARAMGPARATVLSEFGYGPLEVYFELVPVLL
jgi:hypothetical protein